MRGNGDVPRIIAYLIVCEKYGWSWDELMETPDEIVDIAIEKMKVDTRYQENQKMIQEQRSKAKSKLKK